MKIAHVVTYTSPEGAFGGPTKVALTLAEALAERGHQVTVFAGAPRGHEEDSFHHGYRLWTFAAWKLLPWNSFATLFSPGLLRGLMSDKEGFDVIHVHFGRDLVTLPVALFALIRKIPFVLQPHGMVIRHWRRLARSLDALLVKRLLGSARRVFFLSAREEKELKEICAGARLQYLPNGVHVGALPTYKDRYDRVILLARLHTVKQPLRFVHMSKMLEKALPNTEFLLVGPDGGEGAAVLDAIAKANMGHRLRWLGPVSPAESESYLQSASVFVLPSSSDTFPMALLESMQCGTPVVTTEAIDIAPTCLEYGAALVTDGSPEALAQAVLRIYEEPGLAEQLRQGALTYLEEELDIRRVAEELERIYQEG